jgi:hypothetical protein
MYRLVDGREDLRGREVVFATALLFMMKKKERKGDELVFGLVAFWFCELERNTEK